MSSAVDPLPIIDPGELLPGRRYHWQLRRDEGFGELELVKTGVFVTLSSEDLDSWRRVAASVGPRQRLAAQVALGLWNDLLIELWPRLEQLETASEDLILAHRIVTSAYEWIWRHDPQSARVEICRDLASWIHSKYQRIERKGHE